VAQAQHRQCDQARAEDQPGPRIKVGLVRITPPAIAAVTTGSARTAAPMNVRSTSSTHAPTGGGIEPRTRGDDDGKTSRTIATTVAAMPRSMSPARPIDRAAPPCPLRH